MSQWFPRSRLSCPFGSLLSPLIWSTLYLRKDVRASALRRCRIADLRLSLSFFCLSSASRVSDATQLCCSQLLVVSLLLLRQRCKGLFAKKGTLGEGKAVKKIYVIQDSLYMCKNLGGGKAGLMVERTLPSL